MKNNIIKRRSARYPDLYVKKYSRKVFFDNLWNDELIECRGHVELQDGTTVVRPFTKVFNRFENDTDIPLEEECIAVQKINGFMAAATYVGHGINKVVVSTTGSLDSPYVDMAKEYLTEEVLDKIAKRYKGYTVLFEICHPKDPHIINEEPGAYLIGMRSIEGKDKYFTSVANEHRLDCIAYAMQVKRPDWFVQDFNTVLELNRSSIIEGFMVYGLDSHTCLKLKTPYYLALKAAARIKDISKLNKSRIDEEFYPLIDYLKSLDKDYFNNLTEAEKLKLIKEHINEVLYIRQPFLSQKYQQTAT